MPEVAWKILKKKNFAKTISQALLFSNKGHICTLGLQLCLKPGELLGLQSPENSLTQF